MSTEDTDLSGARRRSRYSRAYAAAVLTRLVVEGDHPSLHSVPAGPSVRESSAGEKAPLRTYQDLLKDDTDADLFHHYATSQLRGWELENLHLRETAALINDLPLDERDTVYVSELSVPGETMEHRKRCRHQTNNLKARLRKPSRVSLYDVRQFVY